MSRVAIAVLTGLLAVTVQAQKPLRSDSRSIGEDVAKFLTRWARGQKLED
jgi:hypothetical protein